MSLKTILVSLNEVSRSDTLISLSVALANKHQAHLIGLYVIPAPRVYAAYTPHTPPVVLNEVRTFFEDRAAKIKQAFIEAARLAGVEAEWRKIESASPDIVDGVIEHGLQADVIIASQRNELGNDAVEEDFCESLVMESGRPVIVIPHDGSFNSIGENVVIGWNGTREASRAIFDAMPLLEGSEATRLIWVDPQREIDKAGTLPGSEMAATLSRHGVKSTAEAMQTNGLGSGSALLTRASDLGADLIVIGAYGHSRLREFVFGGTTRTLLGEMTVPVLMSH